MIHPRYMVPSPIWNELHELLRIECILKFEQQLPDIIIRHTHASLPVNLNNHPI